MATKTVDLRPLAIIATIDLDTMIVVEVILIAAVEAVIVHHHPVVITIAMTVVPEGIMIGIAPRRADAMMTAMVAALIEVEIGTIEAVKGVVIGMGPSARERSNTV